MKAKKLIFPAILLAVLLIAYVAVSFIVGYNTKPAVSEGEFPFSITYEYLGDFKKACVLMEAYLAIYPDDTMALREYEFLKTR